MQSKNIKVPSIKINFIFNLLRVFSAALVGIFTMPYLNRVLGAQYIGKIEYVYTIINYFVLFSALGIPMYGIREVSKNRDSKRELNKVVFELLLILFITTFISYVIIFGVLIHLDFLHEYRDLIVILSGMIFLSNIGAEWYFQGVENQKFITIRYVCVRFVVFCLIFLLIKSKSDYRIYGFLLIILGFGANIINMIYIGHTFYQENIKFNELNLKRHLKPILTIFVATISINIYLQLDIFMIGSISGDKYVGYYAMVNKLIRYVISFITIIGAVMLPRLSYLIHNDKRAYYFLLRKSITIMMMLAIPCAIFFYAYSANIVNLMAGEDFSPAIITMKILSPLCIIVSIAYFFGFLILYPQNLEKIYTKATIYSAIFSLMVNFFAIKYYQQNGAAVVAIISEGLAIIVMSYFMVKQKIVINFYDSNLLKILVSNLLLILFFIFYRVPVLSLYEFSASSIIYFGIYFLLLILLKEENLRGIIMGIKTKLLKN